MSRLEQLAQMGAQIVISAEVLKDMLNEHYRDAWLDGVRAGKEIESAAHSAKTSGPATKSQAAKALGFSEGTIDNMRKRGDIESYEYGGQVRIEWEEIERFKRNHKSTFTTIKQL